MKDPSYI